MPELTRASPELRHRVQSSRGSLARPRRPSRTWAAGRRPACGTSTRLQQRGGRDDGAGGAACVAGTCARRRSGDSQLGLSQDAVHEGFCRGGTRQQRWPRSETTCYTLITHRCCFAARCADLRAERGGEASVESGNRQPREHNSRGACTLLCSLGSFQSRSAVPGSEPATARLVTSM